MSAFEIDVVDLVTRWIHVIASIMWVGNSLLFNWLDRRLEKPGGAGMTPSPTGTIWLLHSGGFYYVEKTLLTGAAMPSVVHWFKWQAYATWLTGFLLLVIVYWAGARAVLVDPTVAALSSRAALAVAIGAVTGGWLLYECIQRLIAPRAPAAAIALWMVGLTAIAVALTQLLDGRAAFLHVGAMLGTIMAGNVFFTIVPSQRALVASVSGAGGPGAPLAAAALSARAKRVSIHNNYFVFPVIALMISGHFPSLYGHPHRTLLLLMLIAGGASVRHVLNLRFTNPAWRPMLASAILITVIALFALPRTGSSPTLATVAAASGPVAFADARHVIDRRCATCHSAQPSDMTFGTAPAGVMFDTPAQISAHVTRVRERAVVTRTMPPGNKTNMTAAERALIDRWIAEGAQLSR